MNIGQLKVYVGDVLGEFDSLYYKTHSGVKLVNNDSMSEVIEFSKLLENVATLFVYHMTSLDYESDDDMNGLNDMNDYKSDDHVFSDEEFEEIRKNSRLEEEKLDQERRQQGHYVEHYGS